MTPVILYQGSAQTDARACGPKRRKFLLPPNNPGQLSAYSFDSDFESVLSGVFPPAPTNTPAYLPPFNFESEPNTILTGYSQPQPTNGGRGKYSATFAIVPASWDDYQEYAYSFIGYSGYVADPTTGIIEGTVAGRLRETKKVIARIHWDYFVVDPAGILGGLPILDSGGNAITTVASAAGITIAQALKYYISTNPTWLYDYLSDTAADVPGTPYPWTFYTTPTRTLYESWIAAGTQFLAEDQTLKNYAGNIWGRQSVYITPQ